MFFTYVPTINKTKKGISCESTYNMPKLEKEIIKVIFKLNGVLVFCVCCVFRMKRKLNFICFVERVKLYNLI